MQIYDVLEHPVVSEKAVSMIETENKIVFRVNKEADKYDIKAAVEKTYNVKVVSVNVVNGKGQKKAIVKLDPKFKATELASKLGMV